MPEYRHIRIPVLGKAVPPLGDEFVSVEAASGIVLLLAAVAALIWANTDTAGYTSWWGHELTVGSGDLAITESLVHWVNDALMTIFFFVVGLEIKRELVTGELRDRSRAALPVIAAVGGMVVPALIYVAVNVGGDGMNGWAIPMATDIAFAVAVLAIAGSRVPGNHRLRVQGLDRVERSDPVAPSLRVGLGEVEVNVVVRGVAGDDEADVRGVQAAGLVGVGVAEFDHDELVALEVDGVAFEWLREYEFSRKLAIEARRPE